ncbi:3'-5' exoribonuclease YhaM family protein [Acididesulfobacillus acetoxydans]|nr:HD domain-containing protein [Acididesulfobacillus acetoxydans]
MLKDCQAGEKFSGTVLVTEWKESPFRSKPGSFIVMTCQDSSGTLPAKLWETEARHFEWLREKDVFHIEASVSEYRGALELSVGSMRPAEAEEIDLTQLLMSSPLAEEILERRLQALRRTVRDESLSLLLNRILDHPEFGVLYRRAPAAVKIHQPYLRGLWEHSVAVTELALELAGSYSEVNTDLLTVGALLHDVGKIFEYNFERAVSYTTEGRLLGHILMGVDLISREIAAIPHFPPDVRTKLLHIIASHHGRYEWQSPRRPKSMEAIIIHYADALEAELWQFRRTKDENPDEEWSPYVRPMERYLYLGK